MPGVAGKYKKVSEGVWMRQEFSGHTRIVRVCQELQGFERGCQELTAFVRHCQEFPG